MHWFTILANDVPDSAELRAAHRDAHRERIERLADQGRVLTAGPLPVDPERPGSGLTGSLIIASFADMDEARRWAEADPFQHGGVYESIEVRHYRPIFGASG